MAGIKIDEPALSKTDILRALAANLQQLSFDINSDVPVFTADVKQTKDGIICECTNGTVIELKLIDVKN